MARRQKYDDPPGFKTCRRCAVQKPAEAFPVNAKLRDGIDSWCRDCHRDYDRAKQEKYRRDRGMMPRRRRDDPEGFKTCRRCGELKPLDGFHRDRTQSDGRTGRCRDCYQQEQRARGVRSRNRYADPPGFKTCRRCEERKALSEFPRAPRTVDGHGSNCRPCVNARQREIRALQPKRPRKKSASRKKPPTIPGYKWCTLCNEEKPLDEFHRNSKSTDGRVPACKACDWKRRPHSPRPVDPAPEGYKTCSACREVKPLGEFYRDKRGARGVSAACKTCRLAASDARRRERGIPERQRYADLPGIKTCRRCKRPKPVAEFSVEHRNRDGLRSWCDDCSNERTLEWHRANPAAMGRLRAVRRGAEEAGRVAETDWLRVVRRHCGRCAYCARPNPRPSMDHIIPVTRGGQHFIGNLLPVCKACNSSKADRLLVEWRYRSRTRARLVGVNARPPRRPVLP